jgi:lipoprotein-anchoring transpeptidase ErfK/SrfK
VPDDDPIRPVRLNAAPRLKSPPRSKSPRRPRTRKPRRKGDSSSAPYWIAVLLVVILGALVAAYIEAPQIKAWFSPGVAAGKYPLEPLPQHGPAPSVAPKAPVVTPPAPQPTAEELKRKLREQADAATRKLEASATNTAPAKPLAVKPAPAVVPMRALPLDANVLTTERIAAYQVALERIHFSCGFVDGDQGMRTQRMLRAYQQEHELPITGFLDPATRAAIGEPGEPFLTYTVKEEDVASIMPKPQSWREKAKASRLGYNDIWELLAEKFHCTRGYLKALNRDVATPVAGTQVIGPKVFPAAPLPHAASLRIYLGETSLEALDAHGHVIAFFPCSIAKDKNKRPHGELTVKVVDDHPDYTFDPALFADAAKAEGITHKLTIPPGPRNPVGTTWVGLSLPGYGIHGTPDPEAISRTQSHGCFRLANWNAEKVLKMVSVGTPVDVEP